MRRPVSLLAVVGAIAVTSNCGASGFVGTRQEPPTGPLTTSPRSAVTVASTPTTGRSSNVPATEVPSSAVSAIVRTTTTIDPSVPTTLAVYVPPCVVPPPVLGLIGGEHVRLRVALVARNVVGRTVDGGPVTDSALAVDDECLDAANTPTRVAQPAAAPLWMVLGADGDLPDPLIGRDIDHLVAGTSGRSPIIFYRCIPYDTDADWTSTVLDALGNGHLDCTFSGSIAAA